MMNVRKKGLAALLTLTVSGVMAIPAMAAPPETMVVSLDGQEIQLSFTECDERGDVEITLVTRDGQLIMHGANNAKDRNLLIPLEAAEQKMEDITVSVKKK